MFVRSLYDSVEAFIARLEEDLARPPDHIIRVELYRIHLERAAGILRWELNGWRVAQRARIMSPSDLSQGAFETVAELLKKAAWCAFVPSDEGEDYATSEVISVVDDVGESGVVSVADQTICIPEEVLLRQGRSR